MNVASPILFKTVLRHLAEIGSIRRLPTAYTVIGRRERIALKNH